MFATIHHLLALRKQRKHEAATKRSPHWPALERHHLSRYPHCAACGGRDRVQVHHARPFHLRPELELDPENLISLCMAKSQHCHLAIGHGGDFKAYNPNVRAYAGFVLSGCLSMAEATYQSRLHRAFE